MLTRGDHVLVADTGRGGEAVVLPPGGDAGGHGQAGSDQGLHLGVLDGQDGVASGAQHLVGQCQGQADGTGDGAGGDVGVHSMLLSKLSSQLEIDARQLMRQVVQRKAGAGGVVPIAGADLTLPTDESGGFPFQRVPLEKIKAYILSVGV